MSDGVLALVDDPAVARGLAAGFEEEAVPIRIERASGDAEALARDAARRSPAGLGIAAVGGRVVVVLAAAPGRPYLEAPAREARRLGHDAARLLARRPLRGRGRAAEGLPPLSSPEVGG